MSSRWFCCPVCTHTRTFACQDQSTGKQLPQSEINSDLSWIWPDQSIRCQLLIIQQSCHFAWRWLKNNEMAWEAKESFYLVLLKIIQYFHVCPHHPLIWLVGSPKTVWPTLAIRLPSFLIVFCSEGNKFYIWRKVFSVSLMSYSIQHVSLQFPRTPTHCWQNCYTDLLFKSPNFWVLFCTWSQTCEGVFTT